MTTGPCFDSSKPMETTQIQFNDLLLGNPIGELYKDALRFDSALKLRLEFHKTTFAGDIGLSF